MLGKKARSPSRNALQLAEQTSFSPSSPHLLSLATSTAVNASPLAQTQPSSLTTLAAPHQDLSAPSNAEMGTVVVATVYFLSAPTSPSTERLKLPPLSLLPFKPLLLLLLPHLEHPPLPPLPQPLIPSQNSLHPLQPTIPSQPPSLPSLSSLPTSLDLNPKFRTEQVEPTMSLLVQTSTLPTSNPPSSPRPPHQVCGGGGGGGGGGNGGAAPAAPSSPGANSGSPTTIPDTPPGIAINNDQNNPLLPSNRSEGLSTAGSAAIGVAAVLCISAIAVGLLVRRSRVGSNGVAPAAGPNSGGIIAGDAASIESGNGRPGPAAPMAFLGKSSLPSFFQSKSANSVRSASPAVSASDVSVEMGTAAAMSVPMATRSLTVSSTGTVTAPPAAATKKTSNKSLLGGVVVGAANVSAIEGRISPQGFFGRRRMGLTRRLSLRMRRMPLCRRSVS
ncbi:hypothetical protein BC829DRAFT_280048 [Chytridium lagenaria]|nr:hypothetical protein BC829DRAFT_280048 [Chytridium lagenaria]